MIEQTNERERLYIGDVIPRGPNKGWIYCTRHCGKRGPQAFLVAPEDGGVMLWAEAMAYARRAEAEIPTLRELYAIHRNRNEPGLRGTFTAYSNRAEHSGTYEDGYYWSTNKASPWTGLVANFHSAIVFMGMSNISDESGAQSPHAVRLVRRLGGPCNNPMICCYS